MAGMEPRSDSKLDEREDAAVFAHLLEQHRTRIFGYLLALVQNFSDAEDLYQQSALVMWEKFRDFSIGTDFGSWAISIAHLTAMNFVRGRSRKRALFSDASLDKLAAVGSIIGNAEVEMRSSALTFCLDTLSERQRRLLKMRFGGDRSLQDIAAIEQRTVPAVSMAITRIRRTLLSCIERRIASEAR